MDSVTFANLYQNIQVKEHSRQSDSTSIPHHRYKILKKQNKQNFKSKQKKPTCMHTCIQILKVGLFLRESTVNKMDCKCLHVQKSQNTLKMHTSYITLQNLSSLIYALGLVEDKSLVLAQY